MGKFEIDFIGVGGMKCASTWLASCLREHPQICLPKHRKELRFFNKRIYNSDFFERKPRIHGRCGIFGLEWYGAQFSHCKEKSKKGEFSPQYFIDPVACQRIKKTFPRVKIIAILRNPVERAYSEYLASKKFGGQSKRFNFRETIEKNPSVLEKGFYAKHLKKYLNSFSEVKIIFLDDVKKNPEKEIQLVYEFLEVDKNFVPRNLEKRVFEGKLARFQFINDIVNFGINFVIKHNLKFVYKIGTLLYLDLLIDGIRKKNVKPGKRESIGSEDRKMLIDFYRKDIKELEKLAGKDLKNWLC